MIAAAKQGMFALLVFLVLFEAASADVQRKKITSDIGYLIIEILDDDLVHCEISAIGSGPSANEALYTSPMVFKTDYPGPASFTDNGDTLETAHLKIIVNTTNLCTTFRDKTKGNVELTTLCPVNLDQPWKGFNFNPAQTQHVYGLGQQLKVLGSADGDWIAHGIRAGGEFGNTFEGFQEAAVGNVQIPVLYAVGENQMNYALLLDNVYKHRWDFTVNWWEVRMFGDHLRFYLMAGPDLPDLRTNYLELVGAPPVPPRNAFGLWVSEFGYDNWEQIDTLRAGMREQHFPLDGFVLDLNWFGGVNLQDLSKSRMGRLNWDIADDDGNSYFFPQPSQRIADLATDHLGLTVIEESYLANTIDTFSEMPPDLSTYHRTNGQCEITNQTNPVTNVEALQFWGTGRMIDWSDPKAGQWVHEERRFPNLVQKGVTSHWTDLGEPETFRPEACYEGVEVTSTGLKNEHSDIHNLYNFLWNESIWKGYFDKRSQTNPLEQINPRPFILTRSGAAGIQRYGAAMWSGDIAANLQSLASHFNAQLHMSFSGIDFYGSDIGGFRREVLPFNNKEGVYRGYDEETYTQWLANGAWFDVPVRPHTDNEFVKVTPPYATAPHLVGKIKSNLVNLQQRYELIPYYYSLAYRAHLFGEPLVPPLVFYYQNDPNVRRMGHEKLIGKDLLVGVVSRYGEYERDIYLPEGKWSNYHTNEWFSSTGQTLRNIPVYRGDIFTLPVFARAGAILPQMFVDQDTKDAFGHRLTGASAHQELIVRVYADTTASTFTLYEDDGNTLNYHPNGRPLYHHRTTELSQQQVDNTITVTIHPAVDVNGNQPFAGAINTRDNVVKLVMDGAEGSAVSVNGTALPKHLTRSAFEAAANGWHNAGPNLILAKSGPMNVYQSSKTFVFTLHPHAATTSVNFVCDKGLTNPEESVFVVGSISALGNWDPQQAIKLHPNVYYEYIWNPPTGLNATDRESDPTAPVWTHVISPLPPNTLFEWKCLKKRDDGSGDVQWQPGNNNFHTTTAAGYAGRTYGSF